MPQPDPSLLFDETHAANYDERFAKLAPLRDLLNLFTKVILSGQPEEARILCAGAGTGADLIYLAEHFPRWRFTAVEPSAPMLDVCRRKVTELGLEDRCEFHHGFLDSLPPSEPFDAATSILVSHFILDPDARAAYFRMIASHLRPDGCLVHADLAFDTASPAYPELLSVWMKALKGADVPAEELEKIRQAYGRDVALWPPEEVRAMIAANGFKAPVPFYQAGLIHAWYARRE